MNESIGYTVTINIVITFIVIVFVFLSNILIYYKSNKVGNVIVDSIEKYSGFNDSAHVEIEKKLTSIGYNKLSIKCSDTVSEKGNKTCTIVDPEMTQSNGYCVYECDEGSNNYYYKIKANMMINIPIINDILNGTVFSRTGNIYNFTGRTKPAALNPPVLGDIDGNGVVDNNDAVMIQKYKAKLIEFDEDQFYAADVDGDGVISDIDARKISALSNNEN